MDQENEEGFFKKRPILSVLFFQRVYIYIVI